MIVEVWCRPWRYPPAETYRPLQGAIWFALTSDPEGSSTMVRDMLRRHLVYKHPSARSAR